jgi:saccharopine dehydrogenase (NAD+, L-lysine-forming)
MSRVLIIGAGGVGGVVAHKCAQVPEVFSEIVLASRTIEKCEKIQSRIDRPIEIAKVDADDLSELVDLIEEVSPDLIINAALPYQDLTIMEACLATGVDYLDTANYEPRDEARFCYR